MHVIAAKAVALKEAMSDEFKAYQQQVVINARAMASVFIERGFDVVSNGTDNHMFLLSLINKGLTGKEADAILNSVNITVNKNTVPNDPQSPFVTSGIRIGTPAVTSRNFTESDCAQLAHWICDALLSAGDNSILDTVRENVASITAQRPVYAQ